MEKVLFGEVLCVLVGLGWIWSGSRVLDRSVRSGQLRFGRFAKDRWDKSR